MTAKVSPEDSHDKVVSLLEERDRELAKFSGLLSAAVVFLYAATIILFIGIWL